MKEHEPGKMPSAPEIRTMLLGYLQDAEFGTPIYTALGDVLHIRLLEDTLHADQRTAEIRDKKFESIVREVSDLRLAELEIALMRLRIHEHEVTMAGDHNAFMNIVTAVDTFQMTCIEEDGDIIQDLEEAFYARQTGEVLST